MWKNKKKQCSISLFIDTKFFIMADIQSSLGNHKTRLIQDVHKPKGMTDNSFFKDMYRF